MVRMETAEFDINSPYKLENCTLNLQHCMKNKFVGRKLLTWICLYASMRLCVRVCEWDRDNGRLNAEETRKDCMDLVKTCYDLYLLMKWHKN